MFAGTKHGLKERNMKNTFLAFTVVAVTVASVVVGNLYAGPYVSNLQCSHTYNCAGTSGDGLNQNLVTVTCSFSAGSYLECEGPT